MCCCGKMGAILWPMGDRTEGVVAARAWRGCACMEGDVADAVTDMMAMCCC